MGIRHDGREPDQLRDVTFTRDFTELALGSVLVEFGHLRAFSVLHRSRTEYRRGSVAKDAAG